MKDYAFALREGAHESDRRVTITDGRPLTWDDVEHLTNGSLGRFSLPCPYCAPEKVYSTRLKLERATFRHARWNCFYCGERGSVSKDGPVDPASEAEAREATARRDAEQKQEKTARALALWDEARTVVSSPVIDYLAARAIRDLPPHVENVLRFHPACPFGRDGRRPCMLALMRDVKTDQPRAVHRTWIGTGAKPLGRMALGPIARAAVKLWPANEGLLVVGEGIETTLAASLYIRRTTGEPCRPAWALTVANNLLYLPVLRSIERLVILADHDESGVGQHAAKVCSQRWCDAGREVVTLMPAAPGTDFNDVVRGTAQ